MCMYKSSRISNGHWTIQWDQPLLSRSVHDTRFPHLALPSRAISARLRDWARARCTVIICHIYRKHRNFEHGAASHWRLANKRSVSLPFDPYPDRENVEHVTLSLPVVKMVYRCPTRPHLWYSPTTGMIPTLREYTIVYRCPTGPGRTSMLAIDLNDEVNIVVLTEMKIDIALDICKFHYSPRADLILDAALDIRSSKGHRTGSFLLQMLLSSFLFISNVRIRPFQK